MEPLLKVVDYHAGFKTRRGIFKTLQGLNYELYPGETLAIVGESGSGKSVSQLSYLGLIPSPPFYVEKGEVWFRDKNLLALSTSELNKIRGNEISVIFQEPMTSLNPYLRIGTQLIEPLLVHGSLSKKEAQRRAIESLEQVGIPSPEKNLRAYPHEFSGGMRQRVMIAMALTTQPKILIADEPTTALDVTVQSQILELLKGLQSQFGMSIIFITHDLGVVAGIAHRVMVMYAGKILESGPSESVFSNPLHPYTQGLLKSSPRIDLPVEVLPSIPGSPPDLSRPIPGCPFYERCDRRSDVCLQAFPETRKVKQDHGVACTLYTS